MLRSLEFVGRPWEKLVLNSHLNREYPERCYLFKGKRGLGKLFVSRDLAKSFNCAGCSPESPCYSCRKIEEGRFEDFLYIEEVSVAELRKLRDNLVGGPLEARFRFVVLDISQVSPEVVGVLLKLTEEPVIRTAFILLTRRVDVFKPIESRSFILDFPMLAREDFQTLFGADGVDSWRDCGGIPGNYRFWKSGEYKLWITRIKEFLEKNGKVSLVDTLQFISFMLEEDPLDKLRLWLATVMNCMPYSDCKFYVLEKSSSTLDFVNKGANPAIAINDLMLNVRVAQLNML